MEIKNIFFDYGGTIDSDGIHWRERFYKLYLKAGIKIDYDEFSKAFFDSDDNLAKRHNLKKTGFKETISYQVNDVFRYLKIKDSKKKKEIIENFIEDSIEKINSNKKIFETLLDKGIKLGIISNFYGNLNNVLKSLGILNYFSFVADSGKIGVIKPDKAIFIAALKGLNAEIEDSAMVGDALHRDIKGAHNIGMRHFYLTSKKGEEIKKCCKKMFVIGKLKDILNYV
ncbi:MAG: HAD family hydrolase [Elusimicrobiota bacterium]